MLVPVLYDVVDKCLICAYNNEYSKGLGTKVKIESVEQVAQLAYESYKEVIQVRSMDEIIRDYLEEKNITQTPVRIPIWKRIWGKYLNIKMGRRYKKEMKEAYKKGIWKK